MRGGRCAARRVERQPMRRYATALGVVGVPSPCWRCCGTRLPMQRGISPVRPSRPMSIATVPYRIAVKPGNRRCTRVGSDRCRRRWSASPRKTSVVMTRRAPTAPNGSRLPLDPEQQGRLRGHVFDVAAPVEYYVRPTVACRSQHFTLHGRGPAVRAAARDGVPVSRRTRDSSRRRSRIGGDIWRLRGTEVTCICSRR